jgi:hypothetical protein
MKVATNVTLLCLLILYSLSVFGCGKKEEPQPGAGTDTTLDESKPLSQVKAEAEKMDVDQLKATATKYKEAIEAKEAQVDKLAQDLMKAAIADKASDKMKELNAQMAKINESVEALVARFQIYVEKLKEKGGDTSGLEL